MISGSRYKGRGCGQVVLVMIGIVLICTEVFARGNLSGRFYLTYQESKTPTISQEYFSQHFEAILRDRLLETTALSMSVYLDNAKNITTNRTFRRYRFDLDLSHRIYSFNARVAPKQKVTPLEIARSREMVQNQFSFSLHPPQLPRVRLFYSTRKLYQDGDFAGNLRDMRGDLQYRIKFVEMGLNRWYSKNSNGSVRNTTVTGGHVRMAKSFRSALVANAGYEYQLTESDNDFGTTRKVTNHTINGLFLGRYKRLVTGTLSFSTRFLDTENGLTNETRNDNVNFMLAFFPGSPFRADVMRTYLSTKQNDIQTKSDYATLQLIAEGKVWPRTTGRAQISQRFDIDTFGQPLPANLYFVSLRSKIYPGVDLRTDVSVSKRIEEIENINSYQMSTIFDLFLRPTDKLTITPNVQYVKFSDRVSFVHNDRSTIGLTANYFPDRRINMGLDLRRNNVTRGRQRKDTSAIFNIGVYLRSRSSLNVSYGINELVYVKGTIPVEEELNDKGDNLNVQAQIWLTRKGSLSANYSNVNRDLSGNTSHFSVTFRLDF